MSKTPTKLLPIEISSISPKNLWPYDDGTNDPFWEGGITPAPYTWTVVAIVSPVNHSSHLTRVPNLYNGVDINVGDWVSDYNGNALKIIQISEKTPTSITMVVEDIDRYNTFNDSSGNGDGSLQTSKCIAFELDNEGLPILDPIPSNLTITNFFANLYSRFQRFDPQFSYKFTQMNHGFAMGDLIVINPSTNNFEKYSSTNAYLMPIGRIDMFVPTPHTFFLNPINKIVENILPALPGDVGDYIYATTSGDLSNVPSDLYQYRMYIKLTNSIQTYITGNVAGPSATIGSVLTINDIDVTFSDSSLTSVVDDINSYSSSHYVVASEVIATTVTQTDSLQLAYGVVGAIKPISASINGTVVNFTTETSGSVKFGAGMVDEVDMAEDINAANIDGITAESSSGLLIIKSTNGSGIEIVNVTNDASGYGWAGPTSCTGLPLSTAATTDTYIYLERQDGGPIILQDTSGSPQSELGVYSVHNGKLPIGLSIENYNRKGEVYVVNTIIDRDGLSPLAGDMAYVLDSGEGEWVLYMWDGDYWVQIASYDSAQTDAQTISLEIDAVDGDGEYDIYRVSQGSRVLNVSVEVTEEFNGVNPTILIGDADDNSRLMDEDANDLTTLGSYSTTPSHQYDGLTETDIKAYLYNDSSNIGSVTVTITYV